MSAGDTTLERELADVRAELEASRARERSLRDELTAARRSLRHLQRVHNVPPEQKSDMDLIAEAMAPPHRGGHGMTYQEALAHIARARTFTGTR